MDSNFQTHAFGAVVCGIRRRTVAYLLMACLPLIAGCRDYPKVGPATFELAKALYSVCNAKDEAQLEDFRELLRSKHESGEVTSQEQALLLDITDTAAAGDWQEAEQNARQLLLDQNEG